MTASGETPYGQGDQGLSESTHQPPPGHQRQAPSGYEVPAPPPVPPAYAGYETPGGYPPPAYPQPGYAPQHGYPPPGYPPPPPQQPPFGAPGYPGAGYGYAAPDGSGTNTMAIGSLIASVAGLLCGVGSIIGIVLGVIALNQIRQTRQGGHGLAVAGIAVGVASLVISLIWMTYAIS